MENQEKDSGSGFVGWIIWFGKFILFVCSSGFIFPHVLTAGMDMKKYDEEARKLMM
jgi:hypothetical protein